MSEIIDNRAQRVRTLKDIIKRLHSGEAPEEVKSALRVLVRQTDYCEIMDMEQQLISEGMPVGEIQGMCDLHSQVTREVLVQLPAKPVEPGHPADTFSRENEALRGVLSRMRQAMSQVLDSADDAQSAQPLLEWRQALNDLMDIEKHYQRKEHLLFSCLERHGIAGPSKVMWGKDDEIRGLLKDLGAALRQPATLPEWKLLAATAGESAAGAVDEMIYKEEQILLPMCLRTFTAEEWAEIWASSPRYGWCLVEPREGYRPPKGAGEDTAATGGHGGIALPSGNLELEQLKAIFSALPVDITFVDADDRVAFFSEGPDRIFARSRAIIGRKVQNCHPPRSVDVVDRILGDFRAGRQSVAEFWIDFLGRFVHIRYFAVRTPQGNYLGTLEVTQDISRIRSLTGERRLLQYEAGEPAGQPV